MTTEIAVVLGLALIAIVLFATEKLRIDAIALLVLSTLAVLGLVTPEQAVGGFSNPATVTVAAMFVLAAGLQNSGALSGIGDLLSKARSPFQFLLVLFLVLAVIAPFVNNTAVVAVFIPIVMAASVRIGMSASKALIPLSYVSQMAGVCTLVGTSTNLLVNAIARDLGHPGFTMFEFTALGVICMVVGCIYLLTIGRWLLPDTRAGELVEQYELGKYITELRVMPDSSLIGQSVGTPNWASSTGYSCWSCCEAIPKCGGRANRRLRRMMCSWRAVTGPNSTSCAKRRDWKWTRNSSWSSSRLSRWTRC